MLDGGGRHPLVVMATLHGHYARMLQLDGAPVSGERDAAQLLGLRGSTYPARKAMQQARRLGHDRIVDAISLLAAADLDLRGAKAWPEDLVLEVLVARLARLAR
jgi:DNA polymerase-3 subunit delta